MSEWNTISPPASVPPPGSAATSQACESSTKCLKPPSLTAKDSPLLSQNLEAQPAKRPKVAQVDWGFLPGARFLTPWARKTVRLRISDAAFRGFGQRASDGAQQGGG